MGKDSAFLVPLQRPEKAHSASNFHKASEREDKDITKK